MDNFERFKTSVGDILERLYDENQVKPEARTEIVKDIATAIDAVFDYVGPDGIHKALYGESKKPHYAKSYYTTFNSTEKNKGTFGVQVYIADSKKEATDICDRMDKLIETYGKAKIADFYTAAKLPCSFTDWKFGWTEPGCLRWEKIPHKELYRVEAIHKPVDVSGI